ncbi:hypothetical protein RFI_02987 [Reticulomyxa filosa]|uniref:Calpain catalytic domain-containing protein n=1 Tax=Reticulomyxa filosa TaxID=46433 RepID=X6P8Y3_RETFI|nr:hypothetical protein RFI_02987 [Reticulomyxa filosa]|eukprot:ETO34107.1 hypothetical protein RFI_02987 [Reticulomyxa filosa]
MRPKIVESVTPYTITQTLITDCSFVSSLTVTALYERTFRKKLITSIIYPQNAHGQPIVNSSGKYVVKLFVNGCFRKVEIDDNLPVSKTGQLLCSHSKDENEFWVSLLEKAFLKVMGGYDFPGSTSCEDLHVLTGWIPERFGFHDDGIYNKYIQLDNYLFVYSFVYLFICLFVFGELNVERLFSRLESGQEYGDCLITIATKEMSDEEADSLGLVSSHAYAVLRAVQLGTHRFLLIKNPWAQKRWKGIFINI